MSSESNGVAARPPQCIDCKLAEWKKTATGRLHPSGAGRCRWEYPTIHLPVSMYLVGGNYTPGGGYINRRDRWQQCKQYQPAAREVKHD